MQALSSQHEAWALALLGGIFAMIVTYRVRRLALSPWLYILLGPSAAFLLGSILMAEWMPEAVNSFSSRPTMSTLYAILIMRNRQTFALHAALVCLCTFGAAYLVAIVSGSVRPEE
jgi:hypothetical protein